MCVFLMFWGGRVPFKTGCSVVAKCVSRTLLTKPLFMILNLKRNLRLIEGVSERLAKLNLLINQYIKSNCLLLPLASIYVFKRVNTINLNYCQRCVCFSVRYSVGYNVDNTILIPLKDFNGYFCFINDIALIVVIKMMDLIVLIFVFTFCC